jgi:hypothetical protein
VKWITSAVLRVSQSSVYRMAQANLISGAGKAVGVNTAPTALFFTAPVTGAGHLAGKPGFGRPIEPRQANSSQAGDLPSAGFTGCMPAFTSA